MASPKIIGGYRLGKVIIEGKTKVVYDLPDCANQCLLLNKDRITAGDGVKAHDLKGKAAISNQTNGQVFSILQEAGMNIGFVKSVTDTAFLAKKCEMIPIEWVTRRLATGSFLKRNEGVPEGYRFAPIKTETFFKDDANHDPQWSEEQIVAKKFTFNGLTIGQTEVDIMRESSIVVFEVLEKAWATRDCALIDMKIEFGVDENGEIVVADVIDSDSWRLWPSGDKRLMKDKQVYRNLTTVSDVELNTIKSNFQWISDQLDAITRRIPHKVVILMGSPTDKEHCEKIASNARKFGLDVDIRITSAHKGPADTLAILRKYESDYSRLVFIAVAGRSNGLGPVVSGNTAYPVINCPPVNASNVSTDLWSSINVPSGLGCGTVMYPEAAALNAAQILGIGDFTIWSKLRVKILSNVISLKKADKAINN